MLQNQARAEAAFNAQAAREQAMIARQEANAAAVKIQALQRGRKARLEARLPPEPETGASAARILVRMPDGKRATRRFAPDTSLSALVDYVCIQLASSDSASPTNRWQLVSQHPPLKLGFAPDASAGPEVASQTFTSAGLAPSAQLHVAAG